MLFLASPKSKAIDSTTPKSKARLVAKGFRQEHGVDFGEMFSPVVKMTTLRFMLDVVATDILELIQVDVKTTYLHSDLKEEIYMEQPKGFVATGQEHLVCRLRKSLYGLKQAPDSGTRSSTISSSRSASQRAMRTTVSSPKQLKTGLSSSSSSTWTTCYSPVGIPESSPNSCGNCG